MSTTIYVLSLPDQFGVLEIHSAYSTFEAADAARTAACVSSHFDDARELTANVIKLAKELVTYAIVQSPMFNVGSEGADWALRAKCDSLKPHDVLAFIEKTGVEDIVRRVAGPVPGTITTVELH